ncbi:MAG: hypothetical protein WCS20_08015 [Alphaproteobacteria bacterium]
MKRVLIVGNSHVAALRSGWETLSASLQDRVDVAFFSAPVPFFDKLGFDAPLYGDVTPNTMTHEHIETLAKINGHTRVDLESFDEILLAGMYWPGRHEITHFLKAFAVDGLYDAEIKQRLTLTAFIEFYQAILEHRAAGGFWSTLRRPNVTLMLSPMPVAIIRQLDAGALLWHEAWASPEIDMDKMRPILDYKSTLAQTYYASRGIDLLPQPATTLTEIGLTKDIYCRDRLDLAGSPDHKFDAYHMNGAFGAICLQAYFDRIMPGQAGVV